MADHFRNFGPLALLMLSGYFAWMGSIGSLALVASLAAAVDDDGRFRPQVRIGWLMAAITIVAAVIGLWPVLLKAIGWSFFSMGGNGAPG